MKTLKQIVNTRIHEMDAKIDNLKARIVYHRNGLGHDDIWSLKDELRVTQTTYNTLLELLADYDRQA